MMGHVERTTELTNQRQQTSDHSGIKDTVVSVSAEEVECQSRSLETSGSLEHPRCVKNTVVNAVAVEADNKSRTCDAENSLAQEPEQVRPTCAQESGKPGTFHPDFANEGPLQTAQRQEAKERRLLATADQHSEDLKRTLLSRNDDDTSVSDESIKLHTLPHAVNDYLNTNRTERQSNVIEKGMLENMEREKKDKGKNNQSNSSGIHDFGEQMNQSNSSFEQHESDNSQLSLDYSVNEQTQVKSVFHDNLHSCSSSQSSLSHDLSHSGFVDHDAPGHLGNVSSPSVRVSSFPCSAVGPVTQPNLGNQSKWANMSNFERFKQIQQQVGARQGGSADMNSREQSSLNQPVLQNVSRDEVDHVQSVPRSDAMACSSSVSSTAKTGVTLGLAIGIAGSEGNLQLNFESQGSQNPASQNKPENVEASPARLVLIRKIQENHSSANSDTDSSFGFSHLERKGDVPILKVEELQDLEIAKQAGLVQDVSHCDEHSIFCADGDCSLHKSSASDKELNVDGDKSWELEDSRGKTEELEVDVTKSEELGVAGTKNEELVHDRTKHAELELAGTSTEELEVDGAECEELEVGSVCGAKTKEIGVAGTKNKELDVSIIKTGELEFDGTEHLEIEASYTGTGTEDLGMDENKSAEQEEVRAKTEEIKVDYTKREELEVGIAKIEVLEIVDTKRIDLEFGSVKSGELEVGIARNEDIEKLKTVTAGSEETCIDSNLSAFVDDDNDSVIGCKTGENIMDAGDHDSLSQKVCDSSVEITLISNDGGPLIHDDASKMMEDGESGTSLNRGSGTPSISGIKREAELVAPPKCEEDSSRCRDNFDKSRIGNLGGNTGALYGSEGEFRPLDSRKTMHLEQDSKSEKGNRKGLGIELQCSEEVVSSNEGSKCSAVSTEGGELSQVPVRGTCNISQFNTNNNSAHSGEHLDLCSLRDNSAHVISVQNESTNCFGSHKAVSSPADSMHSRGQVRENKDACDAFSQHSMTLGKGAALKNPVQKKSGKSESDKAKLTSQETKDSVAVYVVSNMLNSMQVVQPWSDGTPIQNSEELKQVSVDFLDQGSVDELYQGSFAEVHQSHGDIMTCGSVEIIEDLPVRKARISRVQFDTDDEGLGFDEEALNLHPDSSNGLGHTFRSSEDVHFVPRNTASVLDINKSEEIRRSASCNDISPVTQKRVSRNSAKEEGDSVGCFPKMSLLGCCSGGKLPKFTSKPFKRPEFYKKWMSFSGQKEGRRSRTRSESDKEADSSKLPNPDPRSHPTNPSYHPGAGEVSSSETLGQSRSLVEDSGIGTSNNTMLTASRTLSEYSEDISSSADIELIPKDRKQRSLTEIFDSLPDCSNSGRIDMTPGWDVMWQNGTPVGSLTCLTDETVYKTKKGSAGKKSDKSDGTKQKAKSDGNVATGAMRHYSGKTYLQTSESLGDSNISDSSETGRDRCFSLDTWISDDIEASLSEIEVITSPSSASPPKLSKTYPLSFDSKTEKKRKKSFSKSKDTPKNIPIRFLVTSTPVKEGPLKTYKNAGGSQKKGSGQQGRTITLRKPLPNQENIQGRHENWSPSPSRSSLDFSSAENLASTKQEISAQNRHLPSTENIAKLVPGMTSYIQNIEKAVVDLTDGSSYRQLGKMLAASSSSPNDLRRLLGGEGQSDRKTSLPGNKGSENREGNGIVNTNPMSVQNEDRVMSRAVISLTDNMRNVVHGAVPEPSTESSVIKGLAYRPVESEAGLGRNSDISETSISLPTAKKETDFGETIVTRLVVPDSNVSHQITRTGQRSLKIQTGQGAPPTYGNQTPQQRPWNQRIGFEFGVTPNRLPKTQGVAPIPSAAVKIETISQTSGELKVSSAKSTSPASSNQQLSSNSGSTGSFAASKTKEMLTSSDSMQTSSTSQIQQVPTQKETVSSQQSNVFKSELKESKETLPLDTSSVKPAEVLPGPERNSDVGIIDPKQRKFVRQSAAKMAFLSASTIRDPTNGNKYFYQFQNLSKDSNATEAMPSQGQQCTQGLSSPFGDCRNQRPVGSSSEAKSNEPKITGENMADSSQNRSTREKERRKSESSLQSFGKQRSPKVNHLEGTVQRRDSNQQRSPNVLDLEGTVWRRDQNPRNPGNISAQNNQTCTQEKGRKMSVGSSQRAENQTRQSTEGAVGGQSHIFNIGIGALRCAMTPTGIDIGLKLSSPSIARRKSVPPAKGNQRTLKSSNGDKPTDIVKENNQVSISDQGSSVEIQGNRYVERPTLRIEGVSRPQIKQISNKGNSELCHSENHDTPEAAATIAERVPDAASQIAVFSNPPVILQSPNSPAHDISTHILSTSPSEHAPARTSASGDFGIIAGGHQTTEPCLGAPESEKVSVGETDSNVQSPYEGDTAESGLTPSAPGATVRIGDLDISVPHHHEGAATDPSPRPHVPVGTFTVGDLHISTSAPALAPNHVDTNNLYLNVQAPLAAKSLDIARMDSAHGGDVNNNVDAKGRKHSPESYMTQEDIMGLQEAEEEENYEYDVITTEVDLVVNDVVDIEEPRMSTSEELSNDHFTEGNFVVERQEDGLCTFHVNIRSDLDLPDYSDTMVTDIEGEISVPLEFADLSLPEYSVSASQIVYGSSAKEEKEADIFEEEKEADIAVDVKIVACPDVQSVVHVDLDSKADINVSTERKEETTDSQISPGSVDTEIKRAGRIGQEEDYENGIEMNQDIKLSTLEEEIRTSVSDAPSDILTERYAEIGMETKDVQISDGNVAIKEIEIDSSAAFDVEQTVDDELHDEIDNDIDCAVFAPTEPDIQVKANADNVSDGTMEDLVKIDNESDARMVAECDRETEARHIDIEAEASADIEADVDIEIEAKFDILPENIMAVIVETGNEIDAPSVAETEADIKTEVRSDVLTKDKVEASVNMDNKAGAPVIEMEAGDDDVVRKDTMEEVTQMDYKIDIETKFDIIAESGVDDEPVLDNASAPVIAEIKPDIDVEAGSDFVAGADNDFETNVDIFTDATEVRVEINKSDPPWIAETKLDIKTEATPAIFTEDTCTLEDKVEMESNVDLLNAHDVVETEYVLEMEARADDIVTEDTMEHVFDIDNNTDTTTIADVKPDIETETKENAVDDILVSEMGNDIAETNTDIDNVANAPVITEAGPDINVEIRADIVTDNTVEDEVEMDNEIYMPDVAEINSVETKFPEVDSIGPGEGSPGATGMDINLDQDSARSASLPDILNLTKSGLFDEEYLQDDEITRRSLPDVVVFTGSVEETCQNIYPTEIPKQVKESEDLNQSPKLSFGRHFQENGTQVVIDESHSPDGPTNATSYNKVAVELKWVGESQIPSNDSNFTVSPEDDLFGRPSEMAEDEIAGDTPLVGMAETQQLTIEHCNVEFPPPIITVSDIEVPLSDSHVMNDHLINKGRFSDDVEISDPSSGTGNSSTDDISETLSCHGTDRERTSIGIFSGGQDASIPAIPSEKLCDDQVPSQDITSAQTTGTPSLSETVGLETCQWDSLPVELNVEATPRQPATLTVNPPTIAGIKLPPFVSLSAKGDGSNDSIHEGEEPSKVHDEQILKEITGHLQGSSGDKAGPILKGACQYPQQDYAAVSQSTLHTALQGTLELQIEPSLAASGSDSGPILTGACHFPDQENIKFTKPDSQLQEQVMDFSQFQEILNQLDESSHYNIPDVQSELVTLDEDAVEICHLIVDEIFNKAMSFIEDREMRIFSAYGMAQLPQARVLTAAGVTRGHSVTSGIMLPGVESRLMPVGEGELDDVEKEQADAIRGVEEDATGGEVEALDEKGLIKKSVEICRTFAPYAAGSATFGTLAYLMFKKLKSS
jgi:hypothetical protein